MVTTVEARSWAAVPTTIATQAAERARNARAQSTLKAYKSDWSDFAAACSELGLTSEPTGPVVAIYVDQLARRGAKVSTIRRRLAAINHHLRMRGSAALSARNEPLASVLQGIRRDVGVAKRQARPLEIGEVRSLVSSLGHEPQGLRDRALILLGFASALRRSELVALDWGQGQGGGGWVEQVAEGLRIRLARSKTNQAGELEEVAVCRGTFASTCPVAAMEAWRSASAGSGAVFRSIDRAGSIGERLTGGSVSRILKGAVERQCGLAGGSPTEAAEATALVSGHSLRAGLVTTGFAAGLTAEDIMRQTRHRDVKVLLAYRRHATAFIGNVSGRVGL